ncbi:MAG: hypothetical protein PARBB_03234 [Parabacteroides distasonis]
MRKQFLRMLILCLLPMFSQKVEAQRDGTVAAMTANIDKNQFETKCLRISTCERTPKNEASITYKIANGTEDLILRYVLKDYRDWADHLTLAYEVSSENFQLIEIGTAGTFEIPLPMSAYQETGSYTNTFQVISTRGGELEFDIQVLRGTDRTPLLDKPANTMRFIEAIQTHISPAPIVGRVGDKLSFEYILDPNTDSRFIGKQMSLYTLASKGITMYYVDDTGKETALKNGFAFEVGASRTDKPYKFRLSSDQPILANQYGFIHVLIARIDGMDIPETGYSANVVLTNTPIPTTHPVSWNIPGLELEVQNITCAIANESFGVMLLPKFRYKLPKSIRVKVNGEEISAGYKNYTYDSENGHLYVYPEQVTAPIEIEAIGISDDTPLYTMTYQLNGLYTLPAALPKTLYQGDNLSFKLMSGHPANLLPASIEVRINDVPQTEGDTYTYDPETGEVRLAGITGNVTIKGDVINTHQVAIQTTYDNLTIPAGGIVTEGITNFFPPSREDTPYRIVYEMENADKLTIQYDTDPSRKNLKTLEFKDGKAEIQESYHKEDDLLVLYMNVTAKAAGDYPYTVSVYDEGGKLCSKVSEHRFHVTDPTEAVSISYNHFKGSHLFAITPDFENSKEENTGYISFGVKEANEDLVLRYTLKDYAKWDKHIKIYHSINDKGIGLGQGGTLVEVDANGAFEVPVKQSDFKHGNFIGYLRFLSDQGGDLSFDIAVYKQSDRITPLVTSQDLPIRFVDKVAVSLAPSPIEGSVGVKIPFTITLKDIDPNHLEGKALDNCYFYLSGLSKDNTRLYYMDGDTEKELLLGATIDNTSAHVSGVALGKLTEGGIYRFLLESSIETPASARIDFDPRMSEGSFPCERVSAEVRISSEGEQGSISMPYNGFDSQYVTFGEEGLKSRSPIYLDFASLEQEYLFVLEMEDPYKMEINYLRSPEEVMTALHFTEGKAKIPTSECHIEEVSGKKRVTIYLDVMATQVEGDYPYTIKVYDKDETTCYAEFPSVFKAAHAVSLTVAKEIEGDIQAGVPFEIQLARAGRFADQSVSLRIQTYEHEDDALSLSYNDQKITFQKEQEGVMEVRQDITLKEQTYPFSLIGKKATASDKARLSFKLYHEGRSIPTLGNNEADLYLSSSLVINETGSKMENETLSKITIAENTTAPTDTLDVTLSDVTTGKLTINAEAITKVEISGTNDLGEVINEGTLILNAVADAEVNLTYTTVVNNGVFVDNTGAVTEVEGKAGLAIEEIRQQASAGFTITLTAKATPGEGYIAVVFTWQMWVKGEWVTLETNSKAVTKATSFLRAATPLTDTYTVNAEDEGLYRCVVTNKAGDGLSTTLVSTTEVKSASDPDPGIDPTPTPNPENPTGVEQTEATSLKVWAANGQLHIQSPKADTVYIITFGGRLYKTLSLPAGEYVENMPRGSYIIYIGKQSYKLKF